MLNKTISLLILIGLLATTNVFVFAQTQSFELKNSQQPNALSKNELFDFSERANDLLDKDSFAKVKKGSITAKAMQDTDKARQKKKFAGMNTTTAVIIGAVLVTAIIIIFATKGDDDRPGNIPCDPLPCR